MTDPRALEYWEAEQKYIGELKAELRKLSEQLLRYGEADDLLKDLRLLFEDPRMLGDTLEQRIARYSEHQRRVEEQFEQETGTKHPGVKPTARPSIEYHAQLSEWLDRKRLVQRIFEFVDAQHNVG